jgi:hypothetical protein
MSAASDAISALAADVDAAQPLADASSVTIAALINEAVSTVEAVDAEIASVAAAIDAADPAGLMPEAMAAALSSLGSNIDAHLVMVDARGLVGRALANLEQVVG